MLTRRLTEVVTPRLRPGRLRATRATGPGHPAEMAGICSMMPRRRPTAAAGRRTARVPSPVARQAAAAQPRRV